MNNHKKKAATAAMLCMAMAMPFGAFAENETRFVTAGTLNLRADASTESSVLGKYGWGTEVLVKGYNGEWAYVDVAGQSGMPSTSVKKAPRTSPVTSTPIPAV